MTTEDTYRHQILQPHPFLIPVPEFYLTLTMGLRISVALKACRIGIQQSCVYSSPMHTVEPCIQQSLYTAQRREGLSSWLLYTAVHIHGSPCIQQSLYTAHRGRGSPAWLPLSKASRAAPFPSTLPATHPHCALASLPRQVPLKDSELQTLCCLLFSLLDLVRSHGSHREVQVLLQGLTQI